MFTQREINAMTDKEVEENLKEIREKIKKEKRIKREIWEEGKDERRRRRSKKMMERFESYRFWWDNLGADDQIRQSGEKKKQAEQKYYWDHYEDFIDSDYIDSMTIPFYHCFYCDQHGKEYVTDNPIDMKNHFEEEHHCDVDGITLDEEKTTNEEHIILESIMEFIEMIRPKPTNYFIVTNKRLHHSLEKNLGEPVHERKPHMVLKNLGLLNRKPREKERLGFNKHGRRVYHLKIPQLKEVIANSEYWDLKIRYSLYTSRQWLSILSDNNPEENTTTEATEDKHTGTDIDDIYYPPDE